MLDSPLLLVTHYVLSKNEFARFINGRKLYVKIFGFSGGDNRDRTGNLQLAKLALSQLSYIPKIAKQF